MEVCKSPEGLKETHTEACKQEGNQPNDQFLSPVSHTVREYQSERAEIRKQVISKGAEREILSSSPVKRTALSGFKKDAPNSIISGSSYTMSGGVKKQFPDGSCYIGECNPKGVPHGKGRFLSSCGDMFEGEFVNGKIEGRGTLTDSTGNKYVGTFIDSMRDGNGVEKMVSGDIYEGQFSKDKRSGYGKILSSRHSLQVR